MCLERIDEFFENSEKTYALSLEKLAQKLLLKMLVQRRLCEVGLNGPAQKPWIFKKIGKNGLFCRGKFFLLNSIYSYFF